MRSVLLHAARQLPSWLIFDVGQKMTEIVDTLKSVHLQNERAIWIREPRNRSSAENLTIFLDGEFYRDRVEAIPVFDGLQASIADSWLVFVSMESVEARWIECPCYQPFAKFVAEELIPWLELRHGELKSVRWRTLAGLSYTGLAAAYVAKEYPGIFQRVISQSGSFWWKDCWLVDQYRMASRLPTAFYLDVGTGEVQVNVQHREDVLQVVSQIEGVRRFRDVLEHTGHEVRYAEFEGGHDFAAWKQALQDALRWALPNKAPEPTPGSVTPRASERVIEMKRQYANRSAARGAPAPRVAHL